MSRDKDPWPNLIRMGIVVGVVTLGGWLQHIGRLDDVGRVVMGLCGGGN